MFGTLDVPASVAAPPKSILPSGVQHRTCALRIDGESSIERGVEVNGRSLVGRRK
jgi:hypothetical protein